MKQERKMEGLCKIVVVACTACVVLTMTLMLAGCKGSSSSGEADSKESASSTEQAPAADAAKDDTAKDNAAKAEEASITPSLGTIAGNVYTNAALGLKFTIPDGYADKTASFRETFATVAKKDASIFASDAAFAAEVDGTISGYPLLKCESSAGDSVQIDFGTAVNSAETHIDGVISSYQTKQMKEDYKATASRADATIAGQEWLGALSSMTVSGTEVSTAVYAKTYGNYIALITITSFSGDPQAMLANVSAAQ